MSSDHEDVNPMPTKKKIKNHVFFPSFDKGENEGYEGHVGGVDAESNGGKDERRSETHGKTSGSRSGISNGCRVQVDEAGEYEESLGGVSQGIAESAYKAVSEDPTSSDDNDWKEEDNS